MNFKPGLPPQNTFAEGSVGYSREKHKELWEVIDRVNNKTKKLADDSKELDSLGQELYQYIQRLSSVDFVSWKEEAELDEKVEKLEKVIAIFIEEPTQLNARKIAQFFRV